MPQPFETLLINMDGSHDRLASMTGQLAAARMPFVRVPGLRGDALPPALHGLFFDGDTPSSGLKVGEIGCFAAHLSVFQGMVSGRHGAVALVLEDDCMLPGDLRETIGSVLQILPPDWELVRLCNTPKRAYVPLARLPSGKQVIRYSRSPNYAGAYLVNLSGARKLLQNGRQAVPFDEYLRRPWLHGCSVYGLWPPVVEQRLDLPSCIEAAEGRRAGREWAVNKALRKLDLRNLTRRIGFNIAALGARRWLACAAINGGARLLRRRAGQVLLHKGSAWLTAPPSPAPVAGAQTRATG